MGADLAYTNPSRPSSDDEDDDDDIHGPEAPLHPVTSQTDGDDDNNVATFYRLRRLPPQGGQNAGAVLLPGEPPATAMSVYMMMHRYG